MWKKLALTKFYPNEEIRTIISAIGAGIGKGQMEMDKIRYHKVIIMTDADIDGSHIKTLLLTFFYRQMPELIERGHIYIAQPPLYRMKKGKEIYYLKDEQALNEKIFNRALDDIGFKGKSREEVRQFLFESQAYKKALDKTSQLETNILVFVLSRSEDLEEIIQNPKTTEREIEKFGVNLKEKSLLGFSKIQCEILGDKELSLDKDKGLLVTTVRFGHVQKSLFDQKLALSSKWKELKRLYQKLENFQPLPFIMEFKGEKETFNSYREFAERVTEICKKGLYIQRYKGLGEMNPEQLWETTLNPDRRHILKINLDDVLAANETFNLLMGERVEPRRDFIYNNALNVKELDV